MELIQIITQGKNKSKSETRGHIRGKMTRNPSTLITTFSNKSMKDMQKSLEKFNLKYKDKILSPPHRDLEINPLIK